MKLSLLNSSETVQMSMSGGEAVSLSLKTGAVQTGGSLSIGHGLKWESGALCVWTAPTLWKPTIPCP